MSSFFSAKNFSIFAYHSILTNRPLTTSLVLNNWAQILTDSYILLEHTQEDTAFVIWYRTAEQTSTCTPSSSRAPDFGTSYQNTSPCQRPLRASRGVWQVFISLYRTVFRDFNLQQLFYRHLVAPHHNLVNSPSTTMLQSGPCTVWEEEEEEEEEE